MHRYYPLLELIAALELCYLSHKLVDGKKRDTLNFVFSNCMIFISGKDGFKETLFGLKKFWTFKIRKCTLSTLWFADQIEISCYVVAFFLSMHFGICCPFLLSRSLPYSRCQKMLLTCRRHKKLLYSFDTFTCSCMTAPDDKWSETIHEANRKPSRIARAKKRNVRQSKKRTKYSL